MTKEKAVLFVKRLFLIFFFVCAGMFGSAYLHITGIFTLPRRFVSSRVVITPRIAERHALNFLRLNDKTNFSVAQTTQRIPGNRLRVILRDEASGQRLAIHVDAWGGEVRSMEFLAPPQPNNVP